MPKMHELLAIEEDLVGRANTIVEETINSFKHKAAELYTGLVKTYKPFDEADRDLVPPATKEIVDSVPSKLRYTAGKVSEEYDFLLQKETTNQAAKADLVIDGKVLLKDAPVNFLLTLERRLEKFRGVLLEAPTLPNGIKWVPDDLKGPGFFKLETPEIQYRTRNTPVPVVLYEATDKHPAQVKEATRTDTVGAYTEMKFDGRLTSRDKSALLDRIDILLREVKKAIRRANQIDVVDRQVGGRIFNFLLNGEIKEL
jgi:hypothetical protein